MVAEKVAEVMSQVELVLFSSKPTLINTDATRAAPFLWMLSGWEKPKR